MGLETLVCLLLYGSSTASLDDQVLARFRAEYLTAAAQWEKRDQHVHGQALLINKDRNQPEGRIDVEFAHDAGSHLAVLTAKAIKSNPSDRFSQVVRYFGDDGSFFLVKKSRESPYLLVGHDKSAPSDVTMGMYNTQFGMYQSAPYSIYGIPLSRIFSDPETRNVKACLDSLDGRSLVKVEFEFKLRDVYTPTVAWFDPDLNWALIKVDYSLGEGIPLRPIQRAVYEKSKEGLPSLVSSMTELGDTYVKCTFQSVEYGSTPKSHFELSHFGLADHHTQSSPIPLIFRMPWMLGLVFCGLLLSYGSWRLARKYT